MSKDIKKKGNAIMTEFNTVNSAEMFVKIFGYP